MERTRPPPRTSQRTRSITRQKKGPRKTLGPTVEENLVQELPNLPGKTHGIKHINPIIVQCDDCLSAHTHRVSVTAVRAVSFKPRHGFKRLRLCAGCWADRGYYEGDYESVLGGSPGAAWSMLKDQHPNWNATKISYEKALEIIKQEASA